MFATLNLQISSTGKALDGAIDPGGIAAESHTGSNSGPLPFSAQLAMRTDRLAGQSSVSGEVLPENGNGLPPDKAGTLANELRELAESELASEAPLRGKDAAELWDRDLNLELAVQYSSPEIPLTDASQVLLLPVDGVAAGPKLVVPKMTEVAPDTRPPSAIEAKLALAEATQMQNATTLGNTLAAVPETGSEAAVLQPLAESLLRDKLPQSSPQSIKLPVVAVNDSTIKLADAPELAPTASVGRAIAAMETLQHPDTRVASTSPTHTLMPAQLPTSLSQFNNELSLSRSDMLADTINTPVRDAAWGDKLGERVLMLSGNQIKTAEIKLTPADLGPLRIRVSVEDGAAHVSFHAQHAVTREALEQAMPRLREMLAENGLSLGQTDVSEQGVADGKADREFVSGARAESGDELNDNTADSEIGERRKTVTHNNLLDTFA